MLPPLSLINEGKSRIEMGIVVNIASESLWEFVLFSCCDYILQELEHS